MRLWSVWCSGSKAETFFRVVGFFVGFGGGTVNGLLEVVVLGLPDLLTLVVLSGGAELGSGAAVCRRSVGSGCVVALRLTSTLP